MDHSPDCRCLLCVDPEYVAYQIGDTLYVEHCGTNLELLVTDVSPIERTRDLIQYTLTCVQKALHDNHLHYSELP